MLTIIVVKELKIDAIIEGGRWKAVFGDCEVS